MNEKIMMMTMTMMMMLLMMTGIVSVYVLQQLVSA